MRTLAIDLGTRRVGLALSDEGGRFATPFDVLQVSSSEDAIQPILQVIKREGVTRVVVGLPLNMDGTRGTAANATIDWTKKLQSQAMLPVIFVDERLSTFDAEQQIISRKKGGEKITRKRRKGQLDALAAAAFLQAFLDGRLPPLQVES